LQVEIDLNESDLAKVFKDQKCRVSPEAYPDKSYEGYVAEIAPEANRQKGTLQVKVQIKTPIRSSRRNSAPKSIFLPRRMPLPPVEPLDPDRTGWQRTCRAWRDVPAEYLRSRAPHSSMMSAMSGAGFISCSEIVNASVKPLVASVASAAFLA
jgi:hypothetical protein